jgi:uncharacterized protein (TIGR02145 family)
MKVKARLIAGIMILSSLILTSFRGQLIEEDEIVDLETVIIGKQEWTAKNLDVTFFRNGDSIPQKQNDKDWRLALKDNQPAWRYLNEEVGNKYGKLYNIYAVIDSRGLAPEGFHVSTDEDWEILTDFLGGIEVAGKKLKSPEEWGVDDTDDSSEFGALGGSLFSYHFDYRNYEYSIGAWWTSTEKRKNVYWQRTITARDRINRVSSWDGDALSVRCVKDSF